MTLELTEYIRNNPRFNPKDARKVTQLNAADLKYDSDLLSLITKLIGFGWIRLADSPRGGAKLCAIPRKVVTKEFDGDSNRVRYWLASQGFACSAKQFYMTKVQLEARGVTFSDDGTFAECERIAREASTKSAKKAAPAKKKVARKTKKAVSQRDPPWVGEDDLALAKAYVDGVGTGRLAKKFGRTETAIRSRIKTIFLADGTSGYASTSVLAKSRDGVTKWFVSVNGHEISSSEADGSAEPEPDSTYELNDDPPF